MGISRQILKAVVVCVVIGLSYQSTTDEDGFFYYQNAEYPKDCQEIKDQCTEASQSENKVYVIKPEGFEEPFEVYCDQTTEGGGWTVFQRRKDNTIDFGRNTTHYKEGFGFLNEEHWLGNEKLAYLTNQKQYELRVELSTSEDASSRTYAKYNDFRVTDEKGIFRMVSIGTYDGSSTASNEMEDQLNADFQVDVGGCRGGWWYGSGSCANSANLNGLYTGSSAEKFHWGSGDGLAFSEMKIRPAP